MAGRLCTICTNPNRGHIDAAVAGDRGSIRSIAKQHGVSDSALLRHTNNCLPARLLKGEEARQEAESFDAVRELAVAIERVQLLLDACDRWLRDPEDPSRYDVGPRAEDLKVTYARPTLDGKLVRRKERLSALLARLESPEGLGVTVEAVESKHSDPRELLLKAYDRLESRVELVAKLVGQLQQEGTVNVTISAEWLELRTTILQVLTAYPEARLAVAEALDGR